MDEVAHQIGLIPILGMMLMGRKLPRVYWLVALGLSVSWFADSAQHFIGGTWGAWYVFLPLQVWLVLIAFRSDLVIPAALVLIGLTMLSWGWSHPGPDQLVTVVGSVAVFFVARGSLYWPLSIYFGAGTVAYLFMTSQVGGDILPAWYVYQSCRALGILIFIGIIAPPVIHRRKGEQCG
jgi:hypothetical protein